MPKYRKKFRLTGLIILGAVVGGAAYLARPFYEREMTIHELLGENKQLKQAITNLTQEDQIGYAKVIEQKKENGRTCTTLRFIETARDKAGEIVLQKEYTVEGDMVYFDALIVKFNEQMVMDGKSRALYLWRRVYGETGPPEAGGIIEQPQSEPKRYADLLELLNPKERKMFWSNIWDLTNDPDKLAEYGITAVYGNVLYFKMVPGLIYVFKIKPSGEFYPETVIDM